VQERKGLMKKKTLCFCIIFTVILVLVMTAGSYLLFFKDSNKDISDETVKSEVFCGYTKNGIVFCVDDLLRYGDAKSRNCVVLCDKPDCQHNKVQGDIDDQTCNAVVTSSALLPAIYHDKLYFVYKDGVSQYRIYESDKNGGNRRELAHLDNVQFIYNAAYEGNYLLCAYQNAYDFGTEDFKSLKLEKPISGLSIINLRNGEVIRIPEKEDYGSEVFKLHYDNNKIYYGYLNMDMKIDYEKLDHSLPETYDYIYQHLIISIWCYDLNTGEDNCVYSGRNYEIKDFNGHYAYLLDGALETTQIYEFNFETGEKTLLVDEPNITVCIADRDRLTYTISNGSEMTYKYYDLAKKEISIIGKRTSAINPMAIIEDKVYVSYNDDNGEYCYGYMPRADYYKNNFDAVVPLFYPNSYGN